jgi:hypothetical protein
MNKKIDHFKLNDDIFLISDEGINLQEVEILVRVFHNDDEIYGNSEEECEELLEQTRNKIGYSKL